MQRLSLLSPRKRAACLVACSFLRQSREFSVAALNYGMPPCQPLWDRGRNSPMPSLLFPLRFAVGRRRFLLLRSISGPSSHTGLRPPHSIHVPCICFLRHHLCQSTTLNGIQRERKNNGKAPIWGKRLLPQTNWQTPLGDITPSKVHKHTLCKIYSRPHLSLVESSCSEELRLCPAT